MFDDLLKEAIFVLHFSMIRYFVRYWLGSFDKASHLSRPLSGSWEAESEEAVKMLNWAVVAVNSLRAKASLLFILEHISSLGYSKTQFLLIDVSFPTQIVYNMFGSFITAF